jgi:hypothetical protein
VEEGGQARNDGKSSAQQRQMSRTGPVTGQNPRCSQESICNL